VSRARFRVEGRGRAVAIAVAFAATLLTAQVEAQQDPPRDTSGPPVSSATPLALRPSRPLELAQEPPHAGLGWKVVAVMALLGGTAFYLRKRVRPKRLGSETLTIVRRASVGFRSELLIVNVEGQRLLIGVTPQSIQSLAVLDGEEAVAPAASLDGEGLGQRFAAMLKAAAPGDGTSGQPVDSAQSSSGYAAARGDGASAVRSKLDDARAAAAQEPPPAGQARGLIALRRRG
jgi:flagellar protein FliO/FliZ